MRNFAVCKSNKSVKIQQVLCALERFAPLPLQEDWDNAGLQIGLTEAEVSGALLCLDVTERVIDEAVEKGCNLVVSHHPLLFRGLKQVADLNDVQRTVRKAIKADICVISMHTNMDNAPGGVNWKIAEHLGAESIVAGPAYSGNHVKSDMAGDNTKDLSTDGTEHKERVPWVMATMPYPISSSDFIQSVKDRFGAASIHCNEMLKRPIRTVAICGGAGDFVLDAAIDKGADAFITGEMHYHQYFGHEQQIQICVIGHYESEQFTTEIFRDIINRECPGVKTLIAQTRTNPIHYY